MYARRRSRKKQYDLVRLGEFLPKALEKEKIYLATKDYAIAGAWKSAVGPLISDQTDPFRYKEGKLYVKVTTSAWLQQLQFMKNEILDKVNEKIAPKKITALYFSIGHTPSPKVVPKEIEHTQFDQKLIRARDKRLINENVSSISDEELRSIVERVMIKEIITRRLRS